MKQNKLPYYQDQGFRVPKEYFGELEENLLNMAEGMDSLTTGKLSEIKSAGYTTPEGYFEELESQILSKTVKQSKVVPFFNKETYYYAAAVAAVFIAIISTFYFTPDQLGESWENIELSVLEEYIDEDYNDLSTSEISSFIFENGYVVDDSDFADLDSEAAFEYLNENLEHPSSILE